MGGEAMEMRRELLRINIDDSPTLPRVLEIIQKASLEGSFGNNCYELLDLLLINRFTWPSFGEWDRRFSAIAFQHRSWANASALEFSPAATEILGRLHVLPQPARHTVLQRPYPMPASKFIERFGAEAFGCLVSLGKARLIRETFEKLPYVPLEHLRGIQRRLSIRGGRSRREASEKISSCAEEQAVAALLMPEYREDFVYIQDDLAGVSDQWFRDRTVLVRLWLMTAQSFFNTARGLEWLRVGGSKLIIQRALTECPFCKPFVGKVISPGIGPFPPFHPGCSCSISIDFEALKEKGHDSSILRQLGISVVKVSAPDADSEG